jgi:HPt (histidine-containing phosphotransfer) domain-containing protein
MNAVTIDPAAFAELQATTGADFVTELVDTFADEAPQMLAEMRTAHASAEADRFRRAAHSLKSNCKTFGAVRLAEMARALELDGMPPDTTPLDEVAAEIDVTLAALKSLSR